MLAVLDTPDDLDALASVVASTGVAVLAVGRGSNLLVADEGFIGVAVVLGEAFATVDIAYGCRGARRSGSVVVRAGAGASLPVVARQCAAAGVVGFEWAVGVPGSVGGAVRMNAGGHGSDMAASLIRVRVPGPGQRRGWLGAGRPTPAVLPPLFDRPLPTGPGGRPASGPGDRGHAEALIAEIVRWRRQHQPGGPNSGSVFTNPPGDSAGRLIDASGAKGLRMGTAQVSTKHANFIQVDEGGRAADVVALMAEVQRRVAAHSGVHLVPETRLVGFDNPQVLIEGR